MNSEVYTSKAPLQESILQVCRLWASLRSKDPSTKVAAAIYHKPSGGLFLGYNGFPAGFPDYKHLWDNRDPSDINSKYNFVVHAEMNAVKKAMGALGDLRDCVLFCTHQPCSRCMKEAIASTGLREVFYIEPYDDGPVALAIAKQCGITLTRVSL